MKEETKYQNITVRNNVQQFIALSVNMPLKSPNSSRAFFYNLNTQLVEKLGYKTSAFLLKLKSEYQNGTIYNYSNRKISRIIGCSPTLAKKNLKTLESFGIVEYHNGNLSIRNIKKTPGFGELKQEFTKILLTNKLSFQEYKDKCALLIIERKMSQQRFMAFKKDQDSTKPMGRDSRQSEIDPKKLATGYRKMSNYLGISLSSFCLLVKRLKKQYGLKINQVTERIKNFKGDTSEFMKYACDDCYAFKIKNDIILHYGSIFSYTSNMGLLCSDKYVGV